MKAQHITDSSPRQVDYIDPKLFMLARSLKQIKARHELWKKYRQDNNIP